MESSGELDLNLSSSGEMEELDPDVSGAVKRSEEGTAPTLARRDSIRTLAKHGAFKSVKERFREQSGGDSSKANKCHSAPQARRKTSSSGSADEEERKQSQELERSQSEEPYVHGHDDDEKKHTLKKDHEEEEEEHVKEEKNAPSGAEDQSHKHDEPANDEKEAVPNDPVDNEAIHMDENKDEEKKADHTEMVDMSHSEVEHEPQEKEDHCSSETERSDETVDHVKAKEVDLHSDGEVPSSLGSSLNSILKGSGTDSLCGREVEDLTISQILQLVGALEEARRLLMSRAVAMLEEKH